MPFSPSAFLNAEQEGNMCQRKEYRVRDETATNLKLVLQIARFSRRTTIFCSYVGTIIGSFGMLVTRHS